MRSWRAVVPAGVAMLLLAAMLGGCGPSAENARAGNNDRYEGPTDPLLAKLRTEDLQEALRQRFRRVQAAR